MLAEQTRPWRSAQINSAALSQIPARAGVYVIADVLEIASLRLRVEPIYVGKTYSLRRRVGEHLDPWRTHNASLSRRLIAGPKNSKFEFWYQVLDRNELNQVEKDLIRTLKPETNIVRYGEENEH